VARPALDGGLLTAGMPVVFGAHTALQLDCAAPRRGRPWGRDEVEPLTWQLVAAARSAGADAYVAAIDSWHQATRTVQLFHENWDVQVSPTLAMPPPLGVLACRDARQLASAPSPWPLMAPVGDIDNRRDNASSYDA
jgi:Asp-tRNA(Asn)/Glu-tRNA(Gln) amidotransferase A subunit family amidase